MSSERATTLVVQVLRTSNTLLRASRRLFRPHGLTEAQFNVLNLLAQHAAGLSQREISEYLVVDRSNVTGLLDRMQALAWVSRKDVPDDRRAWRVVLTVKGRRLWSRTFPLYARAIEATAGALRGEDARTALAALQELERRVDGLPEQPGAA